MLQKKFEEQYVETIKAANLADESAVKGCTVLKPQAMAIWTQIRSFMANRLAMLGYEDMYFPLLTPASLMKKQPEHFNVFKSELLAVKGTAEEDFDEQLFIRPTSEMIIYERVAKWLKETELPLLLNQWCSVIRWETRKPNLMLIRDNEFLWHECHSAHATKAQAIEYAEKMRDVYRELLEDNLAIPVFSGQKPEHRKFPGAVLTLALEAMMPNRKSIQSATSHDLGQNFSKALDIKSNNEFVWQACAGLTTRVIGALVMMHSDENGLVLPPKIAPVQCIFVDTDVKIDNVRTKTDSRSLDKDKKIDEWTKKGIPLIISGTDNYEILRRDTGKTTACNRNELTKTITGFLDEIQQNLFEKAKRFKESHTFQSDNYEEFKDILSNQKGFVQAGWCGVPDCGRKIRKDTKGSLRVVNPSTEGVCIGCKEKAKFKGVFGQSY